MGSCPHLYPQFDSIQKSKSLEIKRKPSDFLPLAPFRGEGRGEQNQKDVGKDEGSRPWLYNAAALRLNAFAFRLKLSALQLNAKAHCEVESRNKLSR